MGNEKCMGMKPPGWHGWKLGVGTAPKFGAGTNGAIKVHLATATLHAYFYAASDLLGQHWTFGFGISVCPPACPSIGARPHFSRSQSLQVAWRCGARAATNGLLPLDCKLSLGELLSGDLDDLNCFAGWVRLPSCRWPGGY